MSTNSRSATKMLAWTLARLARRKSSESRIPFVLGTGPTVVSEALFIAAAPYLFRSFDPPLSGSGCQVDRLLDREDQEQPVFELVGAPDQLPRRPLERLGG